jgi:hypothetical protein
MKDVAIMTEEYTSLVEGIKATLTEGIYNYRQTLLETYHEIGKMLVDSSQRYESIAKLSADSLIPVRTLERCKQFYIKYPEINTLPFGKNVSWHKVVNLLLPTHKEEVVKDWIVCPQCEGSGKVKK